MGTRVDACKTAGPRDDTSVPTRPATVWVSLLATCVVILVPSLTVSLIVRFSSWTPNTATMWFTTGSLSALLLVGGTQWWMRQPGSTRMSFGELMLWRWVRRSRADDVLHEGTKLLVPTDMLTRNGQLEMLRALNEALEVRDPYTRGHSRRVERHAYRTALAMHRSVEDIFNLRVAASLHDIGKIQVPIEVIRKQGPLDAHEWEAMKKHPGAGAQMIANIGHEALVRAVRHHHERWEGGGYPDGIAGEDIPLHARIIAVCDTFDAITSTRSYRAKSSRAEAIAIIKKNSGTQFDPAVVEAFLSALPRGVPGMAAISAMSIPAIRKGLAQVAMMVREAGIAGVAGAIATSGVAGAVTTSVVNPGKYLGRPAVVRAQGDEHDSQRAKKRADEHSAIVLEGSSNERSAGTAAGKDASGSARVKGSRQAVLARAARAKTADAKRQNNRDATDNGKSEEHKDSNNGKANGKGKDDRVVAATADSEPPAEKAERQSGSVRETVERTVDTVEEESADATDAVPPGKAKKEQAPETDSDPESVAVETSIEGGASQSKGKGNPK